MSEVMSADVPSGFYQVSALSNCFKKSLSIQFHDFRQSEEKWPEQLTIVEVIHT